VVYPSLVNAPAAASAQPSGSDAVHLAQYTVGWSVYLNGIREDEDRFGEELTQIGAHLSY
jgi:hypothetical protein